MKSKASPLVNRSHCPYGSSSAAPGDTAAPGCWAGSLPRAFSTFRNRVLCGLWLASFWAVTSLAGQQLLAAEGEAAAPQTGKKILLIAGPASHGYGEHEHFAGCTYLAGCLRKAMPNYEVVVHRNGWPSDEAIFSGTDCVVMYCDGGEGHMVNSHLEFMDKLHKEGTGIVCIHYGVEIPKGPGGDAFLRWIGGYFEAHWSVNPHWEAEFKTLPDHPICRGVKPFKTNDEWYYHMRFREGMAGVTPILTALPPVETLSRPDGPHSGNPDVRKAVQAGEPQHMAWAAENGSGGRGFGFTGGHFHWNWADDNFRKLVLNAIVWSAHGEVPEAGVDSSTPSREQLEENQDEPKPRQ